MTSLILLLPIGPKTSEFINLTKLLKYVVYFPIDKKLNFEMVIK